jgi:hypothetical protein
VNALFDLFLEAVIEVVELLLDKLVFVEVGEDDVVVLVGLCGNP